MNTDQEIQNQAAYEKPAITTYTEAELLEAVEVWGLPGISGGSGPY